MNGNLVPLPRLPQSLQTAEAGAQHESDRGFSIEAVIGAWLDQKCARSGSAKTLAAYRATIEHFRAFLQQHGRDLLYPSALFQVEIADAAQIFSKVRLTRARRADADGALATRQHRLAVLSSFYDYTVKHQHLTDGNPLDLTERPKVEAFAASQAIPPEQLAAVLAGIDTTQLVGKRDKAALLVFLTTGRRVAEVAGGFVSICLWLCSMPTICKNLCHTLRATRAWVLLFPMRRASCRSTPAKRGRQKSYPFFSQCRRSGTCCRHRWRSLVRIPRPTDG